MAKGLKITSYSSIFLELHLEVNWWVWEAFWQPKEVQGDGQMEADPCCMLSSGQSPELLPGKFSLAGVVLFPEVTKMS